MRVLLLLITGCIYAATALPQKTISLNDEDHETRIIDGNAAKRNQFPYMVSIWHETDGHDWIYWCGGVIISESWLLSTASCISSFIVIPVTPLKEKTPPIVPIPKHPILYAVAGTLSSMEDNKERQISLIERTIQHPKRHGGKRNIKIYGKPIFPILAVNDIALGKLVHPLRFTESVQPVQLPTLGAISPGKAVVSGWDIAPGFVLQYLEVNLITNEECNAILSNLSGPGTYPYIVREDRICGLPKNAGESICYGDFGGPLVQNNTLVGIANGIAGDACNQRPKDKPYPNIFANVSSAINFIKLYAEL